GRKIECSRVLLEQRRRDEIDRPVGGLCRKNRCDQQLKRVEVIELRHGWVQVAQTFDSHLGSDASTARSPRQGGSLRLRLWLGFGFDSRRSFSCQAAFAPPPRPGFLRRGRPAAMWPPS